MTWLKRSLVGLLAVLLLALVVLYLTPLDTYVPEVESTLSEQLHEPLRVGHLRIAVWPLPHLELQGVQLGEQDKIVAAAVDVKLDLARSFVQRALVLQVLVRDGVADLVLVRRLADRFADMPVTLQTVSLRELQLSGMMLVAPELVVGPLQAKLEFAPAGELQRIWLALDEQKITATLLPQADRRFALTVRAHDWAPRQSASLLLEDVQVDGVLGQHDLVVGKFIVAMRGMHAAGSGTLAFADDWQLQAKLDRLDVPLAQLMVLLGQSAEMTGAMTVRGTLHAKAKSWSELQHHFQFSGDTQVSHATARISANFQRSLVVDEIKAQLLLLLRLDTLKSFPQGLQLSGDFHLRNGTLTKVDLVQVASNPSKTEAQGVTRFDDLTGLLNVDAAGYHFKDIKIKSGMLNADGRVDVTPALQLSGSLDADVKGTMGLVSMPLVISGTLSAPSVKVSRSALAGAAVGTAILGPGLGTALGVKVGGFLKKLFGKNDGADQGKPDLEKKNQPGQPATK
ncbi:MAG: hypothetical protein HYZ46_00825 [Nitrosomonadales bacterium]|nr:hypothetical protein [Nitrosomonadales bacterium]